MDRDGHAPTATQADRGLTRRGVMRKTAIGIGATATIGGGAMTLENGPVQESEALAPLIAGGFLAGVAIDWALRKYNVYGADAPAEGLTGDVLLQQTYQTALTRESTNGSTMVDNGNIADGVRHTTYTEAKIAAIEQLNAGATETEVLNAATDAIDAYQSTIEGNFLRSWNESVLELESMKTRLDSHPDTAFVDVIRPAGKDGTSSGGDRPPYFGFVEGTYTLPDGTTVPLPGVKAGTNHSYGSSAGGSWRAHATYNAIEILSTDIGSDANDTAEDLSHIVVVHSSGDDVRYLDMTEWRPVWDDLQTTFTEVRNGISLWVTNVYGSVQSGEIEITDLLTPREQAAMMTEDGKYPQAVADLIALNISVDLEREATVSVPETGTTLRGTFALTNSADGPLESGTTYDPATFAGDAYLTTDISLLEGTWSAYQTAVDGGIISLSEEPYEGVVYEVETTAGEIASVAATDWTDSGTGTWTYDASADLETPITEVSAVSFYAETTETQYETIQLDSQFTIDKFMNTESGEEETSANFTSSEPQDDTNYITQEEWDTLEQQNQELIEKYEESQNTGGGGGGLLGGGLFQDTKTLGIVAGGAALAALLFGGR